MTTTNNDWVVRRGDCLELLPTLDACSVDSIVTDPPYGLGFMGKHWDHGVPGPDFWREMLRVAKPGAHLVAFGGSRTHHRMACAIEDAGWEIRDTIMWLYGSGFPKSLNVGDGRGTALKPAHEPIVLARKPLIGTVAENLARFGTGVLNIDACRVDPTGESRERVSEASQDRRYTENGGTNFAATPGIRGGDPAGRWPANIIHDGGDEVLAAFPDAPGQQGLAKTDGSPQGNAVYGALRHGAKQPEPRGDTGSAARFFYCAKASKRDRDEGLEAFGRHTAGEMTGGRKEGSAGLNNPRAGAGRTSGAKNHHPTVKPTALMRYLCRLVTPAEGTVLDPFAGSGSTGKAAVLEGFRFIGFDLDEDKDGNEAGYIAIASARIAHASNFKEAA
jgi:site-specific DNA-methyltransferase (adenine-specific)